MHKQTKNELMRTFLMKEVRNSKEKIINLKILQIMTLGF